MVCHELRIANLEKSEKIEAHQDGFIKSYTNSNHNIYFVC